MKTPKNHHTILALALCLNLIGCGNPYLSEHVQDDEPDSFGHWEIGHTSFNAIDVERENRHLKIDVWYPVDDVDVGRGLLADYPLLGPIALKAEIALRAKPVSTAQPFKLLVFSHGYGSINTQSTSLMENLASHGFIIASIEHTGNTQSSPTDTFDEAAEKRVPDVSFVIDTMFARNQDPSDMFHYRINEGEVGVVGNSFGAMTAIGTAAGWAGAPADARVTAIAPVSAVIDATLQESDRPSPNAGFSNEQLNNIEIPVLLVGGTEDTNVFIENNVIAFEQIPSPVYRVDVIGANHTHFANICDIAGLLLSLGINQNLWALIGAGQLIEPYENTCAEDVLPIEEAERLQNLYVTAFFKKYLSSEEFYDSYLTENYADQNEQGVNFFRK